MEQGTTRAPTRDLQGQNNFIDQVLFIGDRGSEYLRKEEEKIYKEYDGKRIIDGNGGDEITMIVLSDISGNIEEHKAKLEEIAKNSKVRIAAILDDKFYFFRINDIAKIANISRSNIKEFIDKKIIWADNMHKEIKKSKKPDEKNVRIKEES